MWKYTAIAALLTYPAEAGAEKTLSS